MVQARTALEEARTVMQRQLMDAAGTRARLEHQLRLLQERLAAAETAALTSASDSVGRVTQSVSVSSPRAAPVPLVSSPYASLSHGALSRSLPPSARTQADAEPYASTAPLSVPAATADGLSPRDSRLSGAASAITATAAAASVPAVSPRPSLQTVAQQPLSPRRSSSLQRHSETDAISTLAPPALSTQTPTAAAATATATAALSPRYRENAFVADSELTPRSVALNAALAAGRLLLPGDRSQHAREWHWRCVRYDCGCCCAGAACPVSA